MTTIPDNVKDLITAVLSGRELQVTCAADEGQWSAYKDAYEAVGALIEAGAGNAAGLEFRLAPIVVERFAAGWCYGFGVDLSESEVSIEACKSRAEERDRDQPDFFVRMLFEIPEGGETGRAVRLLSSETWT